MRAAFVQPGGPKYPDGRKAAKYGIDTLYYEARDPQIDAAFFDDLRRSNLKPGIMRDPKWNGASPAGLAFDLDHDLTRLGSANKTCSVLADIEAHDAAYLSAFISSWRTLRPTRVTSWTLEPWQAGWFTPALVQQLNSDPNLTVLPQLYLGDMTPQVESLVAMQLVSVGVRWDRVRPFYDAKRLPAAWDGVVFDFNALP